MKIIKYINAHNVVVEFEINKDKKFITTCQYGQFKSGKVKCPYDKSVFGVGYIGEGSYSVYVNGKTTIQYDYWHNIMIRCYCESYHKRQPTYRECEVAPEWHCFQTFAKWFDEHFYNVGTERMQLDKDIICKGNKIYSPDTCVFVPQSINLLFIKRERCRGEFPIGVTFNKQNGKFIAFCSNKYGTSGLGYTDTPEESFQRYKAKKEKYVKQVAEEFKNVIPKELYEAMQRFEISIND